MSSSFYPLPFNVIGANEPDDRSNSVLGYGISSINLSHMSSAKTPHSPFEAVGSDDVEASSSSLSEGARITLELLKQDEFVDSGSEVHHAFGDVFVASCFVSQALAVVTSPSQKGTCHVVRRPDTSEHVATCQLNDKAAICVVQDNADHGLRLCLVTKPEDQVQVEDVGWDAGAISAIETLKTWLVTESCGVAATSINVDGCTALVVLPGVGGTLCFLPVILPESAETQASVAGDNPHIFPCLPMSGSVSHLHCIATPTGVCVSGIVTVQAPQRSWSFIRFFNVDTRGETIAISLAAPPRERDAKNFMFCQSIPTSCALHMHDGVAVHAVACGRTLQLQGSYPSDTLATRTERVFSVTFDTDVQHSQVAWRRSSCHLIVVTDRAEVKMWDMQHLFEQPRTRSPRALAIRSPQCFRLFDFHGDKRKPNDIDTRRIPFGLLSTFAVANDWAVLSTSTTSLLWLPVTTMIDSSIGPQVKRRLRSMHFKPSDEVFKSASDLDSLFEADKATAARVYHRKGLTLQKQGAHLLAIGFFQLEVEMLKREKEDQHNNTAANRCIGLSMCELGLYSKAIPFLQKYCSVHTKPSRKYLSTLFRLGCCYAWTASFAEAVKTLKQAKEHSEGTANCDAAQAVEVARMYSLAVAAGDQGLSESKKLHELLLGRFDEVPTFVLGPIQKSVILTDLGVLSHRLRNEIDALQRLKEAQAHLKVEKARFYVPHQFAHRRSAAYLVWASLALGAREPQFRQEVLTIVQEVRRAVDAAGRLCDEFGEPRPQAVFIEQALSTLDRPWLYWTQDSWTGDAPLDDATRYELVEPLVRLLETRDAGSEAAALVWAQICVRSRSPIEADNIAPVSTNEKAQPQQYEAALFRMQGDLLLKRNEPLAACSAYDIALQKAQQGPSSEYRLYDIIASIGAKVRLLTLEDSVEAVESFCRKCSSDFKGNPVVLLYVQLLNARTLGQKCLFDEALTVCDDALAAFQACAGSGSSAVGGRIKALVIFLRFQFLHMSHKSRSRLPDILRMLQAIESNLDVKHKCQAWHLLFSGLVRRDAHGGALASVVHALRLGQATMGDTFFVCASLANAIRLLRFHYSGGGLGRLLSATLAIVGDSSRSGPRTSESSQRTSESSQRASSRREASRDEIDEMESSKEGLLYRAFRSKLPLQFGSPVRIHFPSHRHAGGDKDNASPHDEVPDDSPESHNIILNLMVMNIADETDRCAKPVPDLCNAPDNDDGTSTAQWLFDLSDIISPILTKSRSTVGGPSSDPRTSGEKSSGDASWSKGSYPLPPDVSQTDP